MRDEGGDEGVEIAEPGAAPTRGADPAAVLLAFGLSACETAAHGFNARGLAAFERETDPAAASPFGQFALDAARAAKDFATSDAIRDELAAEGVEVMDGDPLGWEWKLA